VEVLRLAGALAGVAEIVDEAAAIGIDVEFADLVDVRVQRRGELAAELAGEWPAFGV
jgi:hypothetical protein